jgi:hypothetical protein
MAGLIYLLGVPWFALALVVLGTGAFGYRWNMGLQATERARAALRLLRLHAKGMLGWPAASPRNPDAPWPREPKA